MLFNNSALPRGHDVDVGVGLVNRAAAGLAGGFSQDLSDTLIKNRKIENENKKRRAYY